MIKTIHLENFRKHVDLTIALTPGVNCFRAANEVGKSTVIEAITYAMFGAKGLKDTLDEVVTTGTPTAKLKVDLELCLQGVDYFVKRSKSGAEITFGKETVTGQTEVTKFFERLLGCSADMATKLMVAEQTSLRGALTDGPTAAGKMIEDLANFDLIDTIVELVQTELVSGNTSTLETRKAMYEEQSADVDLADTAELTAQLIKDKAQLATYKVDQAAITAQQPAQDACKAAYKTIATLAVLEKQEAKLKAQEEASTALVNVALPKAPTAEEITALREAVSNAKEYTQLQALKKFLETLDTIPAWEGNLASLQKERTDTRAEILQLKDKVLVANVDRIKLEGKLIKETNCAFCQKDLTDVPEVVVINNALHPRIAELAANMAAWNATAEEKITYLEALDAVIANEQSNLRAFSRAEDHITLDTTNVPSSYVWNTTLTEAKDASAELATAERSSQALTQALAKRTSDKDNAERIKKELAEVIQQREVVGDLADALATLELERAAAEALVLADVLVNRQVGIVQSAESTLALLEANNTSKRLTQTKAKQALEDVKLELVEMHENNALIKKLRVARPQITDKLWSIVLAAVSTYFTDVRGFKSVVTREDNVFKVNGVAVGGGGLSGSAKDALGLAIRIALTKMFLPNTSFLILDEMGAACDDERETAMLGLVSTSGFQQVILVSHSELCDAYADNIITL